MADAVKYRELRIEIRKGVTLVIDVASRADIDAALADLANLNVKIDAASEDEDEDSGKQRENLETADSRLETRAALPPDSLKKKGILVIKDGVPQLLRPGSFSVSDAALVLMFAVEAGTKRPSVSFDEFKAIFDQQNVKSGSPLSMLLNNLKNSGYIDKAAYTKDRTVRLTGKGEKKATEVLTDASK